MRPAVIRWLGFKRAIEKLNFAAVCYLLALEQNRKCRERQEVQETLYNTVQMFCIMTELHFPWDLHHLHSPSGLSTWTSFYIILQLHCDLQGRVVLNEWTWNICADFTLFDIIFRLGSHARFNPSQSSTYSTNGQTFSLQYGSGSLTGYFGYDTLKVSVPMV